jgi:hypothetical protein
MRKNTPKKARLSEIVRVLVGRTKKGGKIAAAFCKFARVLTPDIHHVRLLCRCARALRRVVPLYAFRRRFQVILARDVVPFEHRNRFVPRDFHGDILRHTRASAAKKQKTV